LPSLPLEPGHARHDHPERRPAEATGQVGDETGTGVTINEDLLTAIREFTSTILNPFDLDELLHRLTRQATALVDAVGAGIMLVDENGRLGFVAASEELVVAAERHQHRVRDGVCHEAHATNKIVVANDLTTDDRWPEYTPHIVGLGMRAVVGIPMNAHGQTIGVINIYRDHPTEWREDELAVAEVLAAMGAGYILNANQLRAQHTLAKQLETAIESRDLIGQAKGILMTRTGVDADGAFALLRDLSQRQNRKLRDVAAEIVEQRSHRKG
jgi:GAF domain-containing protein